MPISIYTLCSGFVSTLLVENFTFYDNHDPHRIHTDAQFRVLLPSLCMGSHPRLGEHIVVWLAVSLSLSLSLPLFGIPKPSLQGGGTSHGALRLQGAAR